MVRQSTADPQACSGMHHITRTIRTARSMHTMAQVPLMMEEGYSAKGWLGMLLGVRLWYGFYGTVLESEAAFEGKVDELCRELGEKGKS